MSLHPLPLVNSGIHEALRLLSLVVSGISEGWLHGIPWQVLPLTRTVVKERLVLEAISPCSCSSFSVAWVANFNSRTSAFYKRGRSLVLGCHCSGWEAVGSVVCQKQGTTSLLQKLAVLSSLVHQSSVPVSLECDTLFLFARLSISSTDLRMAQGGEMAGLMDIKKNLRRMYELLEINVVDTKEMAEEVKKMSDAVSYTSLQVSNNDARIDDNESNLREMMGKVDRIQEDLQRLIEMNQANRISGEVAEVVAPMEEESVVQPRADRGNQ